MDDKELVRLQFELRIQAALGRLEASRSAIEQVGTRNGFTDAYKPFFLKRIREQVESVNYTRTQVASESTFWSPIADSESLHAECLAFTEASRARANPINADLCGLTDVFLREIGRKVNGCQWNSFSVLSTEEYFKGLAKIIRLRFPCDGIWELPIAAHEFGHFVASQIGTDYKTFKRDYLTSTIGLGNAWDFYFEEIFADVFATYVAGPAFAFACLLLRFEPKDADVEGIEHPSYIRRTQAIVSTLEQMNNDSDTLSDFDETLQFLSSCWESAVAAAGKLEALQVFREATLKKSNGEPGETDQARIANLAGLIYNRILRPVADDARFTRWKEVQRMQSWLLGTGQPDAGDRFSIAELLNAAWLCRLTPNADPVALNARFLKVCEPRLKGPITYA